MAIWDTLSGLVSAVGSGGSALLDRLSAALGSLGGGNRQRSIAFTVAMIALSAKMAKADGVVTVDEIAAFKELFDVPAGEERNVARLFNLAKQDVSGYEAYAQRIADLYPDDDETLGDIIDGLFHIAKADGYVHEAELAYLENVAHLFGLDDRNFDQIKARHVRADKLDPYNVLGAPRDLDDKAIRQHYRRLVAETHPDRLIARGVPEEFVRIANDRLAVINAAWDQIAAERGLK